MTLRIEVKDKPYEKGKIILARKPRFICVILECDSVLVSVSEE